MKLHVPKAAQCGLVTIYDAPIHAFIKHNSDVGEIQWEDGPEHADVVVLFEEWASRFWGHAETLRNDPLLASYWQKVVTINCDDLGRGFLPGLYTSLNSRNYDNRLHRACAYPYVYNPLIAEGTSRSVTATRWLFSFRGNDESHPIRRRLFRKLSKHPKAGMHLIRTRFHAHSDDQKRAYVEDILDSQFVLCPRGWSPATYRMFEVMELGRCPVIISDDWIPIAGVPWEECSIRVAEADVDDLGSILEGRQVECMRLGARAREVWELHFSEQAKFRSMLRTILELKASWCGSVQDYRERWDTWRFHAANDWLPHQRLASRLLGLLK